MSDYTYNSIIMEVIAKLEKAVTPIESVGPEVLEKIGF
jgi:hypothetical protein